MTPDSENGVGPAPTGLTQPLTDFVSSCGSVGRRVAGPTVHQLAADVT